MLDRRHSPLAVEGRRRRAFCCLPREQRPNACGLKKASSGRAARTRGVLLLHHGVLFLKVQRPTARDVEVVCFRSDSVACFVNFAVSFLVSLDARTIRIL